MTSVRIKSSKGTSPTNAVKFAIDLAHNIDDCNTVCCVFDQDKNYSNYRQALNLVKQENKKSTGVRYLAVPSIPCFELWYLLHVKFTRASYKDAESPCKKLIENLKTIKEFRHYNKTTCENFFDEIASMRVMAIANATQILLEAENDGCMEYFEDPSTRVHVVVEELTRISKGLD